MSDNNTLTPQRAHELYNEKGLSNSQIGEKHDVSEATVYRRRQEYMEMQETVEEQVSSAMDEHITDDEPDDNPYEMATCPACDSDMDRPTTAGEHDCPNCGATLQFADDETR